MEGCSSSSPSSSCKAQSASAATADNKWTCVFCTYLNFANSRKCTVCCNAHGLPLRIEEVAASGNTGLQPQRGPTPRPAAGIGLDSQPVDAVEGAGKWGCPACTYFNCLRTKRCIQCSTQRPLRYGSVSALDDVSPAAKSPAKSPANSPKLSEIALDGPNKWTCPLCTYLNWPNSIRCAMCGCSQAQIPRTPSGGDEPRKKSQGSDHNPVELAEKAGSICITALPSPAHSRADKPTVAIERYGANDYAEIQYFRAMASVAGREIEAMNRVVDYLINEGNIRRALSFFEARLLNTKSVSCSSGFEKGDRLIDVAKKNDSGELLKLIKRVNAEEDRLPCAINSDLRTRLYTKIAQLFVMRGGAFAGQFLPHPHNFNILKFPMRESDFTLEVMRSLMRSAPSIPPSWVFVDCYDVNGAESRTVARPASFLMKNRGGSHSLCDAVFQAMFGVCDRFNILRTAMSFTMLRSSHFFKSRWMEHYAKMAQDCGISLREEDMESDWEETLNAARDEREELEPIHVFALSQVLGRPIVVVPIDDPLELQELGDLAPRPERAKAKFRQLYEGIYLPVLWGSSPVTQSPLITAYKNGNHHAVIVADVSYPRDHEVSRLVRLRKSRHPGEDIFRFLLPPEMDADFLSQLLTITSNSVESISLRRDAHAFLLESVELYVNWTEALLQCWEESREEQVKLAQLERKMAAMQMDSGGDWKERKLHHLLTAKALNVLKTRSPVAHHSHQHYPLVAGLSGPRRSENLDLEEPIQSEDEEEEEEEEDDEDEDDEEE